MRCLLLLALALTLAACDPASEAGRQGNGLYKLGQFPEAISAYAEGLATFTDSLPSRTLAALHNNTGLARHAEGNVAEALASFMQAARSSATASGKAEAEYNAGVAAFEAEQHEASLRHFRTALLARPQFEGASFNWEFVRRKMKENEQQQSGSGDSDQQQNPQPDQQGENGDNQQNQQNDQQGQNQQNEQQGQDGEDEREGQPQDENESQNRRQQPQPDPRRLSEQEAQRILQAIGAEEEKLLRQAARPNTRPRRVEKDW